MSDAAADRREETPTAPSPWSPLARRAFLVLWVATVLSNVGTWMHDVGAGWLMTELDPSPLMVAGVQAATTAPVFLFALIAGATADIVDRRKMLLLANVLMMIAAAGLAILVALEAMTPGLLILFTFLLGAGAAFMAPAWQAIVPQLVPKYELRPAIALNSMGVNVSRAIGPALAGGLIVAVGLAAPFALNAVSFVGILLALYFWRPPQRAAAALPPETLGSAMIAGLSYALYSAPLRATLVRAFAFFACASAFWAMLPLIARDVLEGGPTLYGGLLASVGGGAVLGALALPRISARLGADATVAAGSLGTAVVLAVLSAAPGAPVAIIVCALAGVAWIAVLSSLQLSAQTALPDWVRARGLSIFLTVFFGSMAGGSLLWGAVANVIGIKGALIAAATGAVVLIPLSWRSKLGQGEAVDLTPSSHWPEPPISDDIETSGGPVMVQIRYRIDEARQAEFIALIKKLGGARRRLGAFAWRLARHGEAPDVFVETWLESSWTHHLRMHSRVSGEDQELQIEIRKLLDSDPEVAHMLPV